MGEIAINPIAFKKLNNKAVTISGVCTFSASSTMGWVIVPFPDAFNYSWTATPERSTNGQVISGVFVFACHTYDDNGTPSVIAYLDRSSKGTPSASLSVNVTFVGVTSTPFWSDVKQDVLYNGKSHNGFYRGKNFGTITSSNINAFCTEHEIGEGNFKDLYLGDYFVIQDGTYNVEWMIAEFDYSRNFKKSDSAWVTNHTIAIIPRGAGIEKKRFNSTDSTSPGVFTSELGTYLASGDFATRMNNVLGDHRGNGRAYTSLSCDSDGTAASVTSGTANVVIPSENEFFGSSSNGKNPHIDCSCKHLLPVFNFISPNEFSNEEFWVGGIANGTQYQCTRHGGYGLYRANATSTAYYVRPMIFIK